MFVETLTPEEMCLQVQRDYPTVRTKMNLHIDSILKIMRKTSLTSFNKYFEYISPKGHNRWVYKIISNGKRENTQFITICYWRTQKGYAAISYQPTQNRITYYTPHFIERYAQRKHHTTLIKDIKEFMTTFIEENIKVVITGTSPQEDEKQEINMHYKHGLGFGTLYSKLNFIEMRTFINNNMLKGDQVEKSYAIEEQFNLDIKRPKHKSLKERPYLRQIVFPLPDILIPLLQKGATRHNTALLKFL